MQALERVSSSILIDILKISIMAYEKKLRAH